ncbi:MAG: hypothetical protein A2057_03630 [Ignavibacteria bacterium GWA2_35_9]|nr:MAG: hypothetical protein A2057_03630 [Ignavibacteria bacterium GWA2_35_9]OGU44312.1 MAG: hypothetical protein A2000_01135 [Ignavibacteria bacterium GWB2_36_8]OGU53519.1 MAG: hypothetical protein A2080_06610 [Ignavibacteria bacterium GWC2_36_12]
MKTALIYPYIKRSFNGCNPPLSILYLAASLRQAGKEVMVLDVDEDNLSYPAIVDRLVKYEPQLVGIPLFSTELMHAYEFVKLLKAKNNLWQILIGGPHATASPEEVMNIFNCDFVLRGESENSLVRLTNCIERNDRFDSVGGLTFKKNGKVYSNPASDVNQNLDDIPFPARDLLKTAYSKKTYWRIGHRGTTDIMITSRGCPFNCNFCFKVEKKFRFRSPENVLEELITIRSKGIRNVHFMDDLFLVPRTRCIKILKLIKEEKLEIKFKVRARVDLIDEELLIAMKEAGVIAVVYGIESGSQKMLDLMNKKTTVAMNRNAINLTRKKGLQCYTDILIGYPGETPDTILETEKLLLDTKPTAIKISVMYPFPKTTVYNQAKEQGKLIGDWDIKDTRPWIKLPWAENLDSIYSYSKRIFHNYLLNPKVFFNAVRYTILQLDFQQLKSIMLYLKIHLSLR